MLWPAVTIFVVFIFKRQFTSLLNRLSSFKLGDTEVAFQSPVPDAKSEAPLTKPEPGDTAPSGFLTDSAVRNLIRESGLLASSDEIYRTMQIFVTTSQVTWLVFSKQKIFCVLDDENTRQSGRLIQWCLPKDRADPIRATPHKETVGLLSIGPRVNWLYSTRLYPDPQFIKDEVKNAIAELR